MLSALVSRSLSVQQVDRKLNSASGHHNRQLADRLLSSVHPSQGKSRTASPCRILPSTHPHIHPYRQEKYKKRGMISVKDSGEEEPSEKRTKPNKPLPTYALSDLLKAVTAEVNQQQQQQTQVFPALSSSWAPPLHGELKKLDDTTLLQKLLQQTQQKPTTSTAPGGKLPAHPFNLGVLLFSKKTIIKSTLWQKIHTKHGPI